MSAVFKNAKKKLSQAELRKFMNEHKKQQKVLNKIESPLAKYTDSGQLMCILCKSVVRSEAVWTVHINAKQHKENVLAAKKLQETQKTVETAPKRPLTPEPEESNKKLKGILKNSNSSSAKANLPDNFFDNDKKSLNTNKVNNKQAVKDDSEEMEVDKPVEKVEEPSSDLPEGFFDDPKLDAKARHLEYKNPIDEEWEKFQKEIKTIDTQSAEIIAEDQEEATTERQIDEIEEQMRNWSRVITLEKKKEEVKVITATETKQELEDMSSGEDDEFDEFLDWRSKKSVITLEKKKEEVKVITAMETKQELEDMSSGEDDEFDEFLDWRSKKS